LTSICRLAWTVGVYPKPAGTVASRRFLSSGSASHFSGSTSGGTVHVHGYTRKDGTDVAPYVRSAPHEAAHEFGSSPQTVAPSHPDSTGAAPGVVRDGHGRIKRHEAARAAFERSYPCPTTGNTVGACPGYIVDHIVALKRGDVDAPANMQWQTIDDAKAKDRWE